MLRHIVVLSILVLMFVVRMPVTSGQETTPDAGNPDIIKIYTSWPLSGTQQQDGQSILDAAQLALQHYLEDHDGQGPGGYLIEIIPNDDASPSTGTWDGVLEAENAQACVDDPECMAFLGPYNSGAALVSAPILNEAGIAQVSPANTYPGLTKPWAEGEPEIYRPGGEITYFRTNASDDIQGFGGAAWAECLGFAGVYIVDDGQLYGQGVADAFAQHADEIGLNVIGRNSLGSDNNTIVSLLTQARDSEADLVYGGFSTSTGGLQLIDEMHTLGMFDDGVAFMGPDGLFKTELSEQVANDEIYTGNIYLTFPGLTPQQLTSLSGQRFLEDFVAIYEYSPLPWSTYAYQSMQVILKAIDEAGEKDRAAILDAMRNTETFDGLIGQFAFDENGDPTVTRLGGNVVGLNGMFEFTGSIDTEMHTACSE